MLQSGFDAGFDNSKFRAFRVPINALRFDIEGAGAG